MVTKQPVLLPLRRNSETTQREAVSEAGPIHTGAQVQGSPPTEAEDSMAEKLVRWQSLSLLVFKSAHVAFMRKPLFCAIKKLTEFWCLVLLNYF